MQQDKLERFIEQASAPELAELKRELTQENNSREEEIAELEINVSHIKNKISILVRERKIAGRYISLVNDAMSRLENKEKQEKKDRADRFERLFIEIAEQTLPTEEFLRIKESAAGEIRKKVKRKDNN